LTLPSGFKPPAEAAEINPDNLGGQKMACNATRDEVASAVIDALVQVLDDDTITHDTEPDGDLGLDKQARELLFFPIEKNVQRVGCKFKKFTPNSCGKAKNVGAIIDIICEDFGIK
jgi:hypothetical protein